MRHVAWYSPTWNWFNGAWHEGNPPIIGPRSHAAWLGSSVFDGARFFEGVMPDIELHAARVNRSAIGMGLKPTMEPGRIVELIREGLKKFSPETALYLKPDVLGRGRGHVHHRARSGIDAVLPLACSRRRCPCRAAYR